MTPPPEAESGPGQGPSSGRQLMATTGVAINCRPLVGPFSWAPALGGLDGAGGVAGGGARLEL